MCIHTCSTRIYKCKALRWSRFSFMWKNSRKQTWHNKYTCVVQYVMCVLTTLSTTSHSGGLCNIEEAFCNLHNPCNHQLTYQIQIVENGIWSSLISLWKLDATTFWCFHRTKVTRIPTTKPFSIRRMISTRTFPQYTIKIRLIDARVIQAEIKQLGF